MQIGSFSMIDKPLLFIVFAIIKFGLFEFLQFLRALKKYL